MSESFDTLTHMRDEQPKREENYSEKPQKSETQYGIHRQRALLCSTSTRFNLMNPPLLGKQQTPNEIEIRVTWEREEGQIFEQK